MFIYKETSTVAFIQNQANSKRSPSRGDRDFPTIVFNRKSNFLGCEASRATTRRNLEELRMKTVGPKGKGRVDHLKQSLIQHHCSLSAHSFSLLMPPFTPLVPNNLIRLDVRRIARGVAFEVRFRAHSGRIPPPRSPASPQRR